MSTEVLGQPGVPDWQLWLEDETVRAWIEWAKERGREIVLVTAAGGTAILVVTGSTLIVNALVLGGVTTLGAVLLYLRLPEWLRELILKFSVAADVLAAILTYWLFGETVTALLAAGFVGCAVSGIFWLGQQVSQDGLQPVVTD